MLNQSTMILNCLRNFLKTKGFEKVDSITYSITILLCTLVTLTSSINAQVNSKSAAYFDLSHESKVFGHKKYFRLYLPQGYESSTKHYPVIYFFHGWGGRYFKDENALLEYELIKSLVDKYQVMLVLWDGNISEEEPRPYNIGNHEDVKFQVQMKDYFPELVSYIDNSYRTLTDRNHRGIIGFSMGGFMAYVLAGKYPDRICAAANLHGSPEFFIGYPHNHTLYPLRYTFKNLQDVQLLLHNSTNDELYYLNREVNSGASWEGGLHYSYELFPGGHKIDDPGKTEIFEKAICFVAYAFDHPVIKKEKWSHFDLYPDFSIWDYQVNTTKATPGFVFLKNVNRNGLGIYTYKWLPDGPPVDTCKIKVTTSPIYDPKTRYNLVSFRKEDSEIQYSTIESNEKGEIRIESEGNGQEYGIFKEGETSNIICLDYLLADDKRYLRVGEENKLYLKLFNRGGEINTTQEVSLTLSSPDSSVRIKKIDAFAKFKSNERVIISAPFIVLTDKKPPIDGSPSWLKFKVKITLNTKETEDELIIPVFFRVPDFPKVKIEDRYNLQDSVYGSGDGDGVAEPGEKIMVLIDGYRTRLYYDDPYVEADEEQLVDEVLPAKWPDGFTLSSVIKISKDCPKGHIVELLANFETKSFMPINRKLTWGKIDIKVE